MHDFPNTIYTDLILFTIDLHTLYTSRYNFLKDHVIVCTTSSIITVPAITQHG